MSSLACASVSHRRLTWLLDEASGRHPPWVSDTWEIGLSAWIIQDGNYGEFARGQEAAFAVEFRPHDFSSSESAQPAANQLGAARYHIEGDVVFESPGAWVIDFGLLAYCKGASVVEKSSAVQGEVWLGIDPFFYYEGLTSLPGMPPLVYTWNIERIELDETPWIEVAPRRFERDATRRAWRDVDATDAWNDDRGHGAYVLHCRLLDRPLTRHPRA